MDLTNTITAIIYAFDTPITIKNNISLFFKPLFLILPEINLNYETTVLLDRFLIIFVEVTTKNELKTSELHWQKGSQYCIFFIIIKMNNKYTNIY